MIFAAVGFSLPKVCYSSWVPRKGPQLQQTFYRSCSTAAVKDI
jgi:hypothetical protein